MRKQESSRYGSKFEERAFFPQQAKMRDLSQFANFLPQQDSEISTQLPLTITQKVLDLTQDIEQEEKEFQPSPMIQKIRKIHGGIIGATDNNMENISNALKSNQNLITLSIYNQQEDQDFPSRPATGLGSSRIYTGRDTRPETRQSRFRPDSAISSQFTQISQKVEQQTRPGTGSYSHRFNINQQGQRPSTSPFSQKTGIYGNAQLAGMNFSNFQFDTPARPGTSGTSGTSGSFS